tara:strand:+ start:119 stop:469 length:351 start_codon:yes stop_codon:yes gene_type:complete
MSSMSESQFISEKPDDGKISSFFKVIKQIWKEMTLGVGFWGALRPLVTAILALIPFFFVGQHFNRKHQKGFDWTLLQIPLALTVILWFLLWFYSIFDAWRDATKLIANLNNQGVHN